MTNFVYYLKYFHFLHSLFLMSIIHPSLMIDSNREAIEEINTQLNGLKVETKTYTDIIKESGTWINHRTNDITVSVMLFGGGSGGFSANGGNGGHMVTWSGTIKAGEVVPITIGEGGASGNSGGTTSFGTHCSADGGSQTSGGTTGGGMTCNAGYGGTGGGRGYQVGGRNSGDAPKAYPAQNIQIGHAGQYGGGGGGGGGAVWFYDFTANAIAKGTTGGVGGTYGGNGGSTHDIGNVGFTGSPEDGNPGTDTTTLELEFKGLGKRGSAGTSNNDRRNDPYNSNCYTAIYVSGGAGGGGGYGGNGGNGSDATNIVLAYGKYAFAMGGAGGGGGGYGADGGNALTYGIASNPDADSGGFPYIASSGGGGGGGYGGRGGDGGSGYIAGGCSGQGYGAGGGGDVGGGGGGYGKAPSATHSKSGKSGICIIRYTVKEITLE